MYICKHMHVHIQTSIHVDIYTYIQIYRYADIHIFPRVLEEDVGFPFFSRLPCINDKMITKYLMTPPKLTEFWRCAIPKLSENVEFFWFFFTLARRCILTACFRFLGPFLPSGKRPKSHEIKYLGARRFMRFFCGPKNIQKTSAGTGLSPHFG